MSKDRQRFEKVLALAIDPGAIEGEAVAALLRLRELVKQNPSLAHPPELTAPAPKRPSGPEATFTVKITSVHPDWVLIIAGQLSKNAYELDLKSKIEFDFSSTLTAINIVCDGSKSSCDAFGKEVEWYVDYVNKKLHEPKT
jgi:hypothetical protein